MTESRWQKLPKEVVQRIYEFDTTYHEVKHRVLHQIHLTPVLEQLFVFHDFHKSTSTNQNWFLNDWFFKEEVGSYYILRPERCFWIRRYYLQSCLKKKRSLY